MTIKEIRDRIEFIQLASRDYEAAHSEEDRLYFDFIESVAEGQGAFSRKAKLILTTKNINFQRECA